MVEELVCENLLTVNGWNVDTLGKVIAGNDLKSCGDKELVNYLMKELEFITESLIELISNYWYPVSKCTGN